MALRRGGGGTLIQTTRFGTWICLVLSKYNSEFRIPKFRDLFHFPFSKVPPLIVTRYRRRPSSLRGHFPISFTFHFFRSLFKFQVSLSQTFFTPTFVSCFISSPIFVSFLHLLFRCEAWSQELIPNQNFPQRKGSISPFFFRQFRLFTPFPPAINWKDMIRKIHYIHEAVTLSDFSYVVSPFIIFPR